MNTVDTLYVMWQDPATGRYFPVGRLRSRGTAPEEVYEFVYTKGIDVAKEYGFEPLLAFPDVDKEYLSTRLFPFFANRLLPLSREDYQEYIGHLGLSSGTASPMEILARSGGRRVTDSIELFAPPRSQESTDGQTQIFDYLFLVHGIRHMRECASLQTQTNLHAGDPLFLLHDLQNEKDARALALRTQDYCCIGFIPRFLRDDVWVLLESKGQVSITVSQVNPPPAPVQQRVLCKLSAMIRTHFVPCSADGFQPKGAMGTVIAVQV